MPLLRMEKPNLKASQYRCVGHMPGYGLTHLHANEFMCMAGRQLWIGRGTQKPYTCILGNTVGMWCFCLGIGHLCWLQGWPYSPVCVWLAHAVDCLYRHM
jgi:hypothetical protein